MGSKDARVYVFDCDELTRLFELDREGIWKRFVNMVHSDQVKTIQQVFCELKKFPEVLNRYKPLKQKMCISAADQYEESVTSHMSAIERATPKLINYMGRTGSCDPSDPWLIAVAAAKGWTVVTGERQKGRRSANSIFTACKSLGVPCWNLHQFIKYTGIGDGE